MSKYTRRGRAALFQINFGVPAGRVGRAILRALGTIPRAGDMIELDVEHDDWCAHLRGGVCGCDPVAHVKDWFRARAGMAS